MSKRIVRNHTIWIACCFALFALGCQPESGNTGSSGGGSDTLSPMTTDAPEEATEPEAAEPETAETETVESEPTQETTEEAAPAESETMETESTEAETTEAESSVTMSVEKAAFGKTTDGVEVDLYTCTNANGAVLKMTNYGAIVTALEVPDASGKLANVTLGFDSLDGYLGDHPYFGSTIGRYCNRIGKAKFTLDGVEYKLGANDGENHLHGGNVGFNKRVWNAEPVQTDSAVGVKFTYKSPDGEEGYPGNVEATAIYTLTNDNELVVELQATTDKPCPVNLTNHNYWNLAGADAGSIRNHELMIASDKYLPVDDGLIPTGEQADVAGTPLDFTKPEKIGARLDQIKADPVGYDHCFVLRSQDGSMQLAARVKDPSSGRVMEIYTAQPGIQFYSGNFLDGSEANGGYKQYEGFCLETQHYPDSPNKPEFPNTVLKPGETYSQTTIHKFLAE